MSPALLPITARVALVLGALGLGLFAIAGPEAAAGRDLAAGALLLTLAGGVVAAFIGGLAQRGERVAWVALATGLAAYAFSTFRYATVPSVVEDFPSVADAGLFLCGPLALAALVLLLGARLPGRPLGAWLDAAISALGLAAVAALVFRGTLPVSLDTVTAGQLAYVIGDFVLIGFLAASFAVPAARSMPALPVLALGVAALTIGDVTYAVRIGEGLATPGLVPSVAWPAGVLLLGAAASTRRWPGADAGERSGEGPIAVPLAGACACIPVATFAGDAASVAVYLAAGGLVCVVLRLSLSYREQRRGLEALTAANDRLEHAHRQDLLTGLGNRLHLNHVAPRGGSAGMWALVLIDLDRFKAINDTFGHHTGDRVLQAVAIRLREVARPGDVVVRLAGDEFAVLLEGADAAAGDAVARRIIASLEVPLEIGDHMIYVSGSAGVTASHGEGSGDGLLETLLPQADASMYHAKSANHIEKVSVFDPDVHHVILENGALAAELRGALARTELVVHYQPIVELGDARRVIGFEALVRWQHPQRGLVPPLRFLPLAEQAGLMPELGEWVLDQACSEATRWGERTGPDGPYVSVNVAVQQLQEPRFLERVSRTLETTGLPAERLVVEVTETALATEFERISAVLEGLRGLGVRVFIDDFGTGYSSLGYLRDMPLDGVKLDRAFTRDLTSSGDAWALAQAVVTLLTKLGLAHTAEGIETAAQLAQLRSLGCLHGQGYYFARPQPAAELGDLVGVAGTARARR